MNPLKTLLILLIFPACSKPGNAPSHTSGEIEYEPIITKNYKKPDMDSNVFEKTLSLYNEPYQLRIVTYCMNDSAVVVKNATAGNDNSDTAETWNISHNYYTDITLTKNQKTVFKHHITKDTFKENLSESAYLENTSYEAVRTNRLYFKTTIKNLKNRSETIKPFTIFYKTSKTGQIDLWENSIIH